MRQIVSLYVVFSIVFSIFYADEGFAVEVIKQEKLGPEEVLFVEFGLTPEGTYYPKYVISPDQFKVRGPQGQSITSISLVGRANWSVIPSAHSRYFALSEQEWINREEGTQTTTVYYEDGRVVGTHKWPIYEGGGGGVILTVSDYDGTLAMRSDEGKVFLYHSNGRQIPCPVVLFVDFAAQAPLLGGVGALDSDVAVMMMNLEGNPLWKQRWKIEIGTEERFRFVRLSSKGSFLIAGTTDEGNTRGKGPISCVSRLRLFNKTGQLIMDRTFSGNWNIYRHVYDGGYVDSVAFSPQERFVGIALTDTLLVIDLASGKEVYRSVLPNPAAGERRKILRISVNDSGEVLVLTGNIYIVKEPNMEDIIDPEVFLFSSAGQLLWKQRFQVLPRSWGVQHASWGIRLPENPEWTGRIDWQIRLTDQEIHLFFDDTFYRIRK